MSGQTVGLDLLELRSAIPNLSDMQLSIQIHPVLGARKRMQEEADMGLPCPNVEIEIMLPVAHAPGGGCTGAAATTWASARIESKHPTSKLERKILLAFRVGFNVFVIIMIPSVPPESGFF
jgi:hypothetical protein